jgi:hypothetical protein
MLTRKYKDRLCDRCGAKFTPTCPNKIYCGSKKEKVGCCYLMTIVRHNGTLNGYDKTYYLEHRQYLIDKAKKYRLENVEKVRKNRKKSYWENRESNLERSRKRYRENPEKYFNLKLKKLYGIDADEYNKLFKEQNFCCAICGDNLAKVDKKHRFLDHDHISGKVRGILCRRCNLGIGFFKDDTNVLGLAIKYLEETR